MMKIGVNTYEMPGQGLQQILRLLKIDGPHANRDTTVLDKSKVWWLQTNWKASLFWVRIEKLTAIQLKLW